MNRVALLLFFSLLSGPGLAQSSGGLSSLSFWQDAPEGIGWFNFKCPDESIHLYKDEEGQRYFAVMKDEEVKADEIVWFDVRRRSLTHDEVIIRLKNGQEIHAQDTMLRTRFVIGGIKYKCASDQARMSDIPESPPPRN